MDQDILWFSSFVNTDAYRLLLSRPLCYFSAEFALHAKMPLYAGGLGVLAADFLKEAADRKLPVVGVGLYYHEGYVCQKVDSDGRLIEACVLTRPQDAGLEPVNDKEGKRLYIKVPIHDRNIEVQAWKFQIKTNSVYFLDTNVEQNLPDDKTITNRLYVHDKETRLKQEMVLGIGGVRLLEALSIDPSIYHLNEGHSAMLILDLMRHEMLKRQVGFQEAITLAKRHVVFTNHTLLSGGNEVFSNDLVSTLLTKYAEELQVPTNDIVNLGLVQESSKFSMTMLSLRIAAKSNAVSVMHQKKALEIWGDHPMEVVTNGVHVPTWDGTIGDDIWTYHTEQKRQLLSYVLTQTGVKLDENTLLLGWARRMVSYKRPLALFQDIEHFKKLASDTHRPVRVVMAGFSPPGDTDGAALLQQIQYIATHDLKDYLVYLPNYDMEIARHMIAGCDVWLNTPVVGFEACGTSGMKAALNGVFPLSTRDGWVDEAELFRVGWLLDNEKINKSLLSILENDIIPMYYTNRDEWVAHMWNAREMVLNQFSATRMLRGYVEKMYVPTLQALDH